MKLIGTSFDLRSTYKRPQPVKEGFLPLGALTTIVGRNDTGKTRLLQHLRSALRGDVPTGNHGPGVVLFAEVSPDELQVLATHALADVTRPPQDGERQLPVRVVGERDDWWGTPWSDLDDLLIEGADPLSEWISALADLCGEKERAWRVLLEEAIAPRDEVSAPLVALEPVVEQEASGSDPAPIWSISLAIRKFEALDDASQLALTEIGFRPDEKHPQRWNRWAGKDLNDAVARLLPDWGTYHRFQREAPIMVAPLGRCAIPVAPVALTLPLDASQLRDELEQAVTEVAPKARWAAYMASSEYDDVDIGGYEKEFFHDEINDPWLRDGSRGGADVDESVLDAVSALSRTAKSLLPPFVAASYDLEVRVSGQHEWHERGRLRIGATSTSDGEGETFLLEGAAAGNQLWFQFALLEAAESLREIGVWLDIYADNLYDAIIETDVEDPNDQDAADELALTRRNSLDEYLTEFKSDVGKLASLVDRQVGIDWSLLPAPITYLDGALVLASLIRSRVYLIDEPERHLHPRSQREAASWMSEALRRPRSQVVLATHSVPFMSAEGSDLVYVTRSSGGPTEIHELTGRELGVLDEVSIDLGLDRGQLLAGIDTYLFVEGRVDKAIIEALYAEDLRRGGICVVPLGGQNRAVGVLDATVLVKYSTSRIAVWLDHVSSEAVQQLLGPDAAEAAVAIKGDKRTTPEERTLAELILAAGTGVNESRLILAPHPGADIFDLLSDEAISKFHPAWPGHSEARTQAEKAGAHYKKFYAEEFGIQVDEATCKAIADQMKSSDDFPAPITELVIACSQMTG